ncbi:hypothetical protein RhiirA5_404634, partial [Rhizophagus irregularis]
MKWMKEFIVNKYFELTNIKKKIAIDLVNIPDIYSIDESCLNIMKPTTNLKEFLIPNDGKRCDNNSNYGDYTMKYKICLNKNDIEPSEEFKQAIEQAIEGMKPLIFLKDLFDEYGLFFPLSIILGKSLKNTLPNSSLPFNFENFENLEKVDLGSPPSFTSLRSFLRKGIFVKISDLSDWIRNIDNNLEIIEFNNVIPLYEILEAGQQRKIDYILNTKDNFKIIMTGLTDLKDFDIDTENEKRINIDPTLEDGNYAVFGSIISKKSHSKSDEFFVTFELYDFSGFSAIINKVLETNINIKECYILWIIIGKPSSLSVFSPKNRDCQVDYFSITLQPSRLEYRIVTPFSLSQGNTVFFNSHLSNFESNNGIKLVNWSYNSIKIEIIKPIINVNESNKVYSALSIISNSHDYKIDILCISSNYKNFKIDNEKEDEVPIDLIGYNLTKENFVKANQIIFSDYKKTDKKPRKDGIVTKWVSVKNEDEEYAFKSISEENKISVQNQVIILRELHNWQNIIKFYGLTNYENKWYLVTEWAEHGNLREFYTNNKNSFDPKLKLRISLDIARGLNFLRTVEILHRDIRAENVLITNNNTAKLTNFKLSRSYKADTQNQDNNLEQIRYCAPEILERIPGFKYNNKCEVYSFGILLWEISEEKTPYENHNDFVEITRL